MLRIEERLHSKYMHSRANISDNFEFYKIILDWTFLPYIYHNYQIDLNNSRYYI
jgi:hypothetical protein